MEKVKILIVEDESIVAMDIANRLKYLGYTVLGTVNNGADAIAFAGRGETELVLMDIKLRGPIDGVQAAEEIGRSYDLPVIYITAFADEKTLSRAKVSDAAGYVLKPFQERELMIAIEMAAYKHRVQSELKRAAELKSRLASIVEHAADPIYSLDTDFKILSWNGGAERAYGLSAGEAIGQPLKILLPDEYGVEVFSSAMAKLADAGSSIAVESLRKRKDESIFLAEATVSPVFGSEGSIKELSVIERDITEKDATRNTSSFRDARPRRPANRKACSWPPSAMSCEPR